MANGYATKKKKKKTLKDNPGNLKSKVGRQQLFSDEELVKQKKISIQLSSLI